jgi:hypothetical protein
VAEHGDPLLTGACLRHYAGLTSMKKFLLAAALFCLPFQLRADDYKNYEHMPGWWWQRVNLHGCSVTNRSCHTVYFESSLIYQPSAPPRELYEYPTGWRWRATHQFTTPGFFTSPSVQLFVRFSGGMPTDETVPEWRGMNHGVCTDGLLLCTGWVRDREITDTTPWFGGYDMLTARYAFVNVQYADGTTERIRLSLSELPEPGQMALLLAGLAGVLVRARRRG